MDLHYYFSSNKSAQLQCFDVKLLKFLFLVKSKYFAFFCVFAIQVLHFPPTLYSHIIQDLKKKLVLVLNKVGNTVTIIYLRQFWFQSVA